MALATHPTTQRDRSAALRQAIMHAPLAAFFALSFAITWGLGLAIIARAHGLLPVAVPFVPLFYLGVYAPTAAALIVGSITGGPAGRRAVLAGWTRWRVRPIWYLVALALFPVVGLGAGVLYAARVGVAGLRIPSLAAIVALVAINVSLGPIGEEAGWRGFALPRLQARHGPLGASLLLGAVWGIWHSILWFIPGSGQGAYPFAAFFLAAVAQQVVFTWLANTTRGSLPVLACLHASVNITLAVNGVIGAVPPVPFLVLTVALLAVVGLGLLVATRGRLAFDPAAMPSPGGRYRGATRRTRGA